MFNWILSMKLIVNLVVNLVVISTCVLNLSGCASALLLSTLQGKDTAKTAKPNVNQQVLHAIQSLRALQPPKQQTFTFGYSINQTQLAQQDKVKLINILHGNDIPVVVNIAPAKASTLWLQLSLTQKRVEALQLLATFANKTLNVVFQPSLSDDTVNVVVGA